MTKLIREWTHSPTRAEVARPSMALRASLRL
jgi:hypothetical protein